MASSIFDSACTDHIAGLFYEAAIEPQKLEEGMAALACAVDAEGASYIDISARGQVVAHLGFAPELRALYEEHFVHHDLLLEVASRTAPGRWLSDWQTLGPAFERSEFYNDFLRRSGKHTAAGCILMRRTGHQVGISLQRPIGTRRFDAADLHALGTLAPHLQRASRLYAWTEDLRCHQNIAVAALHAIDRAIWIVDADARLVLHNEAARRTEGSEGTPVLRHGRLALPSRAGALEHAIRQAAQPKVPLASWLHAPGRHGPVTTAVAPMGPTAPGAKDFQRPLAIVMTASRMCADQTRQIMGSLFQLTPAEARLVGLLVAGHSFDAATRALGVKTSTARTQLASAFAKTGTERQADLIRLVTMTPSPLIQT